METIKLPRSPWYHDPFFRYGLTVLLGLTIILVFNQVSGVLSPIFHFVSTLFMPLVISVLFYYLLRPLVYNLEKWLSLPRVLAVIIVYAVIAVLASLFFTYLVPKLANQVTAVAQLSVDTFKATSKTLAASDIFQRMSENLEQRLFGIVQQATAIVSQNLVDVVGYITHLAIMLAVIPFIVFYLLKNDREFAEGFFSHVPEKFASEVNKTLRNIDQTLANYITGLALISASVGSMLFIGYFIIGLDYALILSVIGLVFATIPFVGSFISLTPALLIGLSSSKLMSAKVLIVFIIVQQLESNLISPLIMGQRLHIHPLTLILLLLAAGSLYGLVGLLLATPAYAILKVLVSNLYKIYLLRYNRSASKKGTAHEA